MSVVNQNEAYLFSKFEVGLQDNWQKNSKDFVKKYLKFIILSIKNF